MVSSLSAGARIITYDGCPTYPQNNYLWRLCEEEDINIFGTSPSYLSICMRENDQIQKQFKLDSLKTILSTGSPLNKEHYQWVYGKVKKDVHLASISGGTDIISCFMLGNPLLPVKSGVIQAPGLGMAITAKSTIGEDLIQQKGELVCTKAFPSMPLYFLNDSNNQKYWKTYFASDYYPGLWSHGDYIEIDEDGGVIVYGRSDATLNPGGIRIGTSEIYRCVESLSIVKDSLAISYDKWQGSILLFIVLSYRQVLTAREVKEIMQHIKLNLSPKHLPKKIFQVSSIPYTRSGKKVELTIKKIFNGEPINNLSAIGNSEVIDEFYQLYKDLKEERF